MKSLILGGVKSGKSRYAEKLAINSHNPVSFIATAEAGDAEMAARIERHRAERCDQWQLVEEPLYLGKALTQLDPEHCVLIDCLTLWMSNLLMLNDDHLLKWQLQAFKTAVRASPNQLIIVSNETNMGIVPMGELSRKYCDEMGLLHQALATQCDSVVLMIAGLCQTLKTPDT